jgi:hypothetical protein
VLAFCGSPALAEDIARQLGAPGSLRDRTRPGYIVGAGAMILGGVAAIFFGVAAEGKSLEDVATPLSVVAKPPETIFRSGVDRAGIDPAAP